MCRKRTAGLILGFWLILTPGTIAKTRKVKKIRATANPPQYVAFSRPLSTDEQFHHALDRLTFGPRPGDLDRLRAIGLDRFIDEELHPERVPENPLLEERLAPLETLRMSARDIYVHYPPPQLIRQVARGRARLPDDPELRAVVVSLEQRYLKKQAQKEDVPTQPATGQLDPNDDSDLILKVSLASLLTPQQIEALHTGRPDEKRAVLAAIPESRMTDFAGALRVRERNQLIGLAPVELRRKLLMFNAPQQVVASDLVEGKLLRAIYGNHQLEALMVDFWYNHFNIFLNKGGERYLVPEYERESIRPYVLGNFEDLLLATAKSPAMLFYLDNAESVAPQAMAGAVAGQLPKKLADRGLNENYGRELLELHTLGVDGGYTQKDVIEVARCFTGWTLTGPRKGDTFQFNEKVHDRGAKVVLGVKIPAGGGISDGLKVIDILAHRPATAHFISLKLAQRFVADDPPPSLVNRMAATFRKTDGDIREVMRTMLSSPEFWSQGAYRAKVKSPFEMIVSAVRATDADVTSAFLLGNIIQRLGEPLYRKIEPTGYSSANAEWVSSASLLDRMNFALALAHNRVAGVKVNMDQWAAMTTRDPMELAHYLLDQDPAEQTKQAIDKALNDEELQKQLASNAKAGAPRVPSVVAGLVIGSPEFQRR
ncbi:MAG TPA: DUF1800 domain-containing protein [Bryobacteraceae bacterium]|jgi:uncharacterized protein (DUF1800 family)|nr:DUF1800 domain-containing protein [Bryobacteraceae bacterium]